MEHDRRVIFNADDFGLSPRVNRAVMEAHREGVLGSASLMVTEPHAAEAAVLARAAPRLELGLHLVLCQGCPALAPGEVPGLVGPGGRFPESAVGTGMRLFFAFWLRDQIRRELAAQVDRFRALVGRRPSHLNGHLNIHVHPTVLPIAVELARRHGIPAIRLPREPARIVLEVEREIAREPTSTDAGGAPGRAPAPRADRGIATALNAFIFARLSRRALSRFREAGIAHASACYGVLRPFEMGEALVDRIVDRLEPGLTEIYFHPGHPAHGPVEPDLELAALKSARLRDRLAARGVTLAGYDPAVARDPVAVPAPGDVAPERPREPDPEA